MCLCVNKRESPRGKLNCYYKKWRPKIPDLATVFCDVVVVQTHHDCYKRSITVHDIWRSECTARRLLTYVLSDGGYV